MISSFPNTWLTGTGDSRCSRAHLIFWGMVPPFSWTSIRSDFFCRFLRSFICGEMRIGSFLTTFSTLNQTGLYDKASMMWRYRYSYNDSYRAGGGGNLLKKSLVRVSTEVAHACIQITRASYPCTDGIRRSPPPAFSPRRFLTGLSTPRPLPPVKFPPPPRSFPTRAITHPALSPRILYTIKNSGIHIIKRRIKSQHLDFPESPPEGAGPQWNTDHADDSWPWWHGHNAASTANLDSVFYVHNIVEDFENRTAMEYLRGISHNLSFWTRTVVIVP